MQDYHLFEYAVIRIVPRVEREEFMNVGVILYASKQKFLQSMFHLNEERLRAFSAQTDIEEVKAHLRSFERICMGAADGGPIARLDTASRFRWLTAIRSTVIQSSKVHPGFCSDPKEALEKLFNQLVL
ncbi:DUF3037 domain-containing protein [Agriterribacter sp.]|uniref:DUF3037 domain-containing protein n=1 Tax=Agriterribacter sp. TaxID=2821509 RepID=UPI002D0C0152|nr:DUF3037 domain-containing protein [Agriterribacter sp.]HRP58302.1 DUF3037 domain-containing protein [Agriterribacter sp.]